MTTTKQDAPEILCEAILADARRESEAIIHRAQQEADALLARTTGEAAARRRERLDQARTEATRKTQLIMATLPVEVRRLRSARIQTLLESVREEILRRLNAREEFDYPAVVLTLAVEAIKQMQGSDLVVRCPATDRAALGEHWVDEIQHLPGQSAWKITLAYDSALTGNGPIIEDAAGRQVWDNRLQARLGRMWPELRRQIAAHAGLLVESKPAGGVE